MLLLADYTFNHLDRPHRIIHAVPLGSDKYLTIEIMEENRFLEENLRAYERQFGSSAGSLLRSRRGLHDAEGDQMLCAQNNYLKTKADGLKCELSIKEAEISNLKTRLEATQRSDHETRSHLEGTV